ncbi:hypothetical protein HJG60_008786 [Phyllostomus discolor]|uniref:Uncharacterized protein n=1 Tax=Phyllostomus discolor TaxID=89673 RepID=A0A833YWF7_9CHIR|nr:hypothetical protein HJG60_008786 [Phyllostomus discolor]
MLSNHPETSPSPPLSVEKPCSTKLVPMPERGGPLPENPQAEEGGARVHSQQAHRRPDKNGREGRGRKEGRSGAQASPGAIRPASPPGRGPQPQALAREEHPSPSSLYRPWPLGGGFSSAGSGLLCLSLSAQNTPPPPAVLHLTPLHLRLKGLFSGKPSAPRPPPPGQAAIVSWGPVTDYSPLSLFFVLPF